MTKLTDMLNIGKELESKLQSVNVDSAENLVELGAKEAFLRLKEAYPNVCLVHLYALQGAITDTDFNNLSRETKEDLKTFCDNLNSK